QLLVNSLNSIGFDVIPILKYKGLYTKASFSSIDEYLDLMNDLRKSNPSVDQTEYIYIKNGIVYGQCNIDSIQGQFSEWFSFRFITAILLGKNKYKDDIDGISRHNIMDNQLKNLQKFVNFTNSNIIDTLVE